MTLVVETTKPPLLAKINDTLSFVIVVVLCPADRASLLGSSYSSLNRRFCCNQLTPLLLHTQLVQNRRHHLLHLLLILLGQVPRLPQRSLRPLAQLAQLAQVECPRDAAGQHDSKTRHVERREAEGLYGHERALARVDLLHDPVSRVELGEALELAAQDGPARHGDGGGHEACACEEESELLHVALERCHGR